MENYEIVTDPVKIYEIFENDQREEDEIRIRTQEKVEEIIS